LFIFAFSKKKIIAVLVLTSNEIYGQSEQPHSIQVEIIRAFEVSIAAGNTTLLENITNRLSSNNYNQLFVLQYFTVMVLDFTVRLVRLWG